MAEECGVEPLVEEVFDVGQVEVGDLYLLAGVFLVAEEAFEASHILLVEHSARAVAEGQVAVSPILLEELAERYLLIAHLHGGLPFEEVYA